MKKMFLTLSGVICLGVVGVFGFQFYTMNAKTKRFEDLLGIRTVQVGTDLSLSLVRNINEKCWIGDSDIILTDLEAVGVEEFLVSIEPLRKGGFKSSHVRVDGRQFAKSDEMMLQVPMPTVNKPTPAILTICRDAQLQNSCQGKSALDIAKVHLVYFDEAFYEVKDPQMPVRVKQKKKPIEGGIKAFAKKDRSYFSQYLILEPGKLTLPTKPLDNKQAVKSLLAYERLLLKGGYSDRQGMKRFARSATMLKSVPAKVNQSTLVINLPRRNPACLVR